MNSAFSGSMAWLGQECRQSLGLLLRNWTNRDVSGQPSPFPGVREIVVTPRSSSKPRPGVWQIQYQLWGMTWMKLSPTLVAFLGKRCAIDGYMLFVNCLQGWETIKINHRYSRLLSTHWMSTTGMTMFEQFCKSSQRQRTWILYDYPFL